MHETPSEIAALELLRRAVLATWRGAPDAPFALRRARIELTRHPALSPLGRALDRMADASDARGPGALRDPLVRTAAARERKGAHATARTLYELACELDPGCARSALHAGRAARQLGDSEGALRHYRRARALDPHGRVGRLAGIGEALLSAGGERSLSVEIRQAIRSGDRELAGVGLEARALLLCDARRCREAIRDLCACALRYPDREDRARVAERVALLLLDEGDLAGAREAFLLLAEIGDRDQKARAEARLLRISEVSGDAVGTRRWRDGAVVETAPLPGRAPGDAPTTAATGRTLPLPVLRVWRDRIVEGGREIEAPAP